MMLHVFVSMRLQGMQSSNGNGRAGGRENLVSQKGSACAIGVTTCVDRYNLNCVRFRFSGCHYLYEEKQSIMAYMMVILCEKMWPLQIKMRQASGKAACRSLATT